jgi:hypothetical protein
MQTETKLLIAAVLSLSIGVAFAAPLYVTDMNIKPFPRNPEGPKADTSISVVYANFTIAPNGTDTSGIPKSTLTYEVVLNVTNLSNLGAEIERLAFTAAQDIDVEPSAVGFLESILSTPTNSGSGGSSSASDDMIEGFGGRWSEHRAGIITSGGYGLVRGVWLDDQWINVTWIPGADYQSIPWQPKDWHPSNMTLPFERPALRDSFPTTTTVPALPENASIEGSWIEGVPIMELHDITEEPGETVRITTSTAIFINGTWVDLTGRVRTEHQEPYVRVTNAITIENRFFEAQPPEVSDESAVQFHPNAGWLPQYTFTSTAEGEFNPYLAPKQSRLILLSGTREIYDNIILQNTLAAEKIMLFADEFNCVQDPTVNSTALYTYSGGNWLNQVELQQTQNSYIYNTALAENQMFQPDQWGVEVFITPRS